MVLMEQRGSAAAARLTVDLATSISWATHKLIARSILRDGPAPVRGCGIRKRLINVLMTQSKVTRAGPAGPETLELMRGGRVVSTLTGAFSHSLRESRLTALLGYLVALNPEPFVDLFGFRGVARHVALETSHEDGRSDILIQTDRGVGIVEAKLDASDPYEQAHRYPGQWRALLCHRIPLRKQTDRTIYVGWKELARVLRKLNRAHSPGIRILSADLVAYLEEHSVIKRSESIEIYAREINEPVTLELFLKAQVYGCVYKAGSRIAEALYFAPHFGQRIAAQHPGVTTGISYVARVESVGYARTWREFTDLLASERGRVWLNRYKILLNTLHQSWDWPSDRCFLLLGAPQLAFNPPVRKERLQKGKGWLSKQFLTFDELFRAWKM